MNLSDGIIIIFIIKIPIDYTASMLPMLAKHVVQLLFIWTHNCTIVNINVIKPMNWMKCLHVAHIVSEVLHWSSRQIHCFANTSQIVMVLIGTTALPVDLHTCTDLCVKEALVSCWRRQWEMWTGRTRSLSINCGLMNEPQKEVFKCLSLLLYRNLICSYSYWELICNSQSVL